MHVWRFLGFRSYLLFCPLNRPDGLGGNLIPVGTRMMLSDRSLPLESTLSPRQSDTLESSSPYHWHRVLCHKTCHKFPDHQWWQKLTHTRMFVHFPTGGEAPLATQFVKWQLGRTFVAFGFDRTRRGFVTATLSGNRHRAIRHVHYLENSHNYN